MSRLAPLCQYCIHYRGTDPKYGSCVCDAFPKGIPDEIYLYNYDHRLPFPNDNGIRLEPNPKYYSDENEFRETADEFTIKSIQEVYEIKKNEEERRRYSDGFDSFIDG